MREYQPKTITYRQLSDQERKCQRASHRAAMLGMNELFIKQWKEARTPEERAAVEEKQDKFILGYVAPPSW